jgi:predicted DNA-binding antitoxin AbrB/MazE fold protein
MENKQKITLRSGYKVTLEIRNDLTSEDAYLTIQKSGRGCKEISIPIDMQELFTIRRLFKQMIRIRIRQIINKI